MAVAAKPEISKILLDLGIEPVDVYAVDNAEKTYTAALVEGINTLEVANKGESTRSKILRDELKTIREKKRKGGRIGFKKGTGRSGVPAMDIKSTPTKKLSEKQKKIARLAGDPQKIDKPDFKVLQSRRKNKKVI